MSNCYVCQIPILTGLPYRGTADLFLLDPDGFVVRKWNSQHLNVGVLFQNFQLPLYPKVGKTSCFPNEKNLFFKKNIFIGWFLDHPRYCRGPDGGEEGQGGEALPSPIRTGDKRKPNLNLYRKLKMGKRCRSSPPPHTLCRPPMTSSRRLLRAPTSQSASPRGTSPSAGGPRSSTGSRQCLTTRSYTEGQVLAFGTNICFFNIFNIKKIIMLGVRPRRQDRQHLPPPCLQDGGEEQPCRRSRRRRRTRRPTRRQKPVLRPVLQPVLRRRPSQAAGGRVEAHKDRLQVKKYEN